MASVEKYKKTAVVNLLRHNLREIKNPSNTDIDPARAHLNYSLIKNRNISDYDFFLQRLEQLYCYGRDNVNVLCGWVITAPEELVTEQEHKKFFELVHIFLMQKYGQCNMVQSIVHADEAGRQHLHWNFLPATPDKKHGGEKVNASGIFTRQHMRCFHPELQSFLEKNGMGHAKVQTGVTAGNNRTVEELKAERYNDLSKQVEELKSTVDKLTKELDAVKKELDYTKSVDKKEFDAKDLFSR